MLTTGPAAADLTAGVTVDAGCTVDVATVGVEVMIGAGADLTAGVTVDAG